MSGKKTILAAALICLILLAAIIGLVWHLTHYHIIDFRSYPKDAQTLDLREETITIAHYNKIRRVMPQSQILWNVPMQDTTYPHDAQTLTLPALSQEDVQALAYFPQLKTLDARGCEDYALLQKLRQTYPDLQVLYTLTICGKEYDQDAQTLYVDGLSSEELDLIQFLPELDQVRLESGKDAAQLLALSDLCQQRDISMQVTLGGEIFDASAAELTIHGITDEEIGLLSLLPQLQRVTLLEPEAAADSLIALTLVHPDADISWEKTIFGTSYRSDCTQMDLTSAVSPEGAYAYEQAQKAPIQGESDDIPYQFAVSSRYPLPDMTADTANLIAQVEAALAYFPNLQQVTMCGSILDNEAMAAFRERHRQEYKVVWSVQLGDKLVARTDTPYLMPTKYHVYYFLDKDAVNLKYCEDLVCIDLGHMAIRDISWVSYMPNLTYLVLAHTQLLYIEPISSCKNLKFLELDWSPIRDYAPLKGCTALEDLNLGNTYADFTPIGEMTWLKNLWMIGCSDGAGYRMTQALPNTTVMISGDATVANGWRDLPNYYAMRDAMNMYYMSW